MPKILTELSNEDRNLIKNIKFIFSDMDGTLTENAVFSDKLFTAIGQLKNKGIELYIITGRSAGWVAALAEYLPVNGLIAENGAILFRKVNGKLTSEYLINLPVNINEHRENLRKVFMLCKGRVPGLIEAMDNMFRLADFSIDLGELTLQEIHLVKDTVQEAGFDFTYSNVQIHIMPKGLNKADGIINAWKKLYDEPFDSGKILTIGDSLNDEAMFNSNFFVNTAAVSNVKTYLDKMQHKPKFICTNEEIDGVLELISIL